jgi:genome maintenance exonuclease 1
MSNPLIDKWNSINRKNFNHIEVNLPNLERETIDGVRYYKVPGEDELKRFVSVTSVTSHYNKEKFADWRRRVGEEKANKITKAATTRGTAMHSLIESYLMNEDLPSADPLPKFLFDVAKSELDKIDNIIAIERSMYSDYFKLAGTVDTIANYDGKLSVIDYKSSEKPKPREWIENYWVQAAAYAFMLKELTGKEAEQLVIIMSCENGEIITYIETDIEKYIRLLVKYVKKFTEDKLKEYESLR